MLGKNVLMAAGFVAVLFVLYKICVFIGLPLYPYGMLFFLIPLLGLVPIYQYLEFKQLSGYKQHLLNSGHFTADQLESMSTQEIEDSWRKSLNQA